MRWKSLGLFAVAALLVACTVSAVSAQSYPTQAVRIIVPLPPGGLVDVQARLLQPRLEEAFRQSVVVDNRPGASGVVGTDAVAKASPDGHTLLLVAGSHTVLPATHPKLPYDAERDLEAVVLVSTTPFWFVVNAQVPATTLPEFIALAKANPGKYNYSTTGPASLNHLITELLIAKSGISLQHIPYRGGPPAMQALVRGDAHLLVISPLVALPHIRAGTVRAIATGGRARAKELPEVGTLVEAGFAGFEAVSWVGMLTAAGTPKPVIRTINAEVNRALRDRDVIAKLAEQGVDAAGGAPEDFQKIISTEIRNWTEVARTANIKAP